MRTRWHTEACSSPHVIIDRGTKDPRCQSCGSAFRLGELVGSLVSASPAPYLPTDEERGSLGLFWPNSVSYTRSPRGPSLAVGKTSTRKRKHEEVAHRTSNPPVYEYSLRHDEIRLLHLTSPLGGDLDSPVHATLKTYDDDDYPDYEAVSYTWGGEDDDSLLCKPIFLGPYWDVLLQTKNCWAMLKLLRPPSGQRVVWVDAICIDQNNFTEREDQIAKMCRIYENGMRAFVFLGDDILPRDPLDSGFSSPSDPVVCTLNSILNRKYFSRIWVVQEMILSRRAIIRIGSTEYWVDHQTIRDIANEDSKWDWSRTAAPWFQHASQSWLTAEGQIGLLGLMRLTWNCQSTDPRDKVFGILGLDQSVPPIRPDYSISLQHAFIGMFAHCLINLRDSRVLSMASGIHGWGEYPSWIPAWKSTAALPEPGDPTNEVFKQWSLEWKREFVRQIDRSRYEWQEANDDSEGDHQNSFLEEDAQGLKSRAQWYRIGNLVAQFLPIIGGPESSQQQQPQSRMAQRDGTRPDTILAMNTTIVATHGLPWHKLASVDADTGDLSIPLIHLHCIRYKATLVSQIDELRCYRVSSRVSSPSPEEDSWSDVSKTSESGSSTTTEQLETLDPEASHMCFTTRTADLDDLITPGRDHLFILDKKSSPPLFLILREIETGVFSLVASCEEVFFTHIRLYDDWHNNDVASDIRLRDIRKTWDMSELFHGIALGKITEAPEKLVRAIWLLCHTLLGEPSFEDLCALAHACNDDNLLDTYISLMGDYHPQHIYTGSGPRICYDVLEMRVDPEVWPIKWNIISPLEVRLKTVTFEWWCYEDSTWNDIKWETPSDSTKDLYIRASMYDLVANIRTSLETLKFLTRLQMGGIGDPETDGSPQPSATGWRQPWTIPCFLGSISEIEEDFNFDGKCYHLRIV